MKKKALLLLVLSIFIYTGTMAQCGNIGIVGEFNDWGNDGDHWMTQDPGNPDLWTTTLSLTPSMNQGPPADINELKFREDGSWVRNWGDSDFPSGTGFQNGPNIPVIVDPDMSFTTYNVTFNCATGEYTFENTATIPLADWAVGIGIFLILAFTAIRFRRSIF
ncbi:MAG: hypothetical protein U5Q03_16365 [Bacteroidota bacterium]|nr:hypothetical protein [Bacteroidota bacterium]